MTDDDKALVERLWDHARNVGGDLSYDRLYGSEACQAADLIEAQAAEIERIGQNVLMWLGTYRDDLSQKAIANLQSIASAALGETK